MGTEGGNVRYGPDTEHEISSVRLREVDGGGGIDQSCAAEGGGGPGIKGSLPSGQCSPHAKLMHPQAAMFLHLGLGIHWSRGYGTRLRAQPVPQPG